MQRITEIEFEKKSIAIFFLIADSFKLNRYSDLIVEFVDLHNAGNAR